jgi:hypothetical protein
MLFPWVAVRCGKAGTIYDVDKVKDPELGPLIWKVKMGVNFKVTSLKKVNLHSFSLPTNILESPSCLTSHLSIKHDLVMMDLV